MKQAAGVDKPRVTVSAKIDQHLDERIRMLAVRENRSKSNMVECMLLSALDDESEKEPV